MQKIIFFLISLVAIQNLSFAAFPVLESDNPMSIATELPVEIGDNAAKLSMIYAGVAILSTILLFVVSGSSGYLLLLIAFVSYPAAFIFGLFGLRSRSKRRQAFIGLFSALLMFLILAISAGSMGDPNAKD